MSIEQGARITYLHRPPRSLDRTYEGATEVTAGQSFTIETSPAGEELLSLTVPSGKVYMVSVRVEYVESDA